MRLNAQRPLPRVPGEVAAGAIGCVLHGDGDFARHMNGLSASAGFGRHMNRFLRCDN
jgi:hypothetical protein